MGNCRCDLASHLAQHLRTIQMVIVQIKAMATMAIKVFNIIVIAVLILCQTVERLIVPAPDQPGHIEQAQENKEQHGVHRLVHTR